jgi:hypothetical protein
MAGPSRGPFPARAVRIRPRSMRPPHVGAHGKRPGDRQRALRQQDGVERRIDEPDAVERDVDRARHAGTAHIDRARQADPPAGRDRAIAVEADPPAADRSVEPDIFQRKAEGGRDDAGAGGGDAPGHGVEARLAGDAEIEAQLPVDGTRGNEPVGERQRHGAVAHQVDAPASSPRDPGCAPSARPDRCSRRRYPSPSAALAISAVMVAGPRTALVRRPRSASRAVAVRPPPSDDRSPDASRDTCVPSSVRVSIRSLRRRGTPASRARFAGQKGVGNRGGGAEGLRPVPESWMSNAPDSASTVPVKRLERARQALTAEGGEAPERSAASAVQVELDGRAPSFRSDAHRAACDVACRQARHPRRSAPSDQCHRGQVERGPAPRPVRGRSWSMTLQGCVHLGSGDGRPRWRTATMLTVGLRSGRRRPKGLRARSSSVASTENASPADASKVTARSAACTDVSAPGTGRTMRAARPGG